MSPEAPGHHNSQVLEAATDPASASTDRSHAGWWPVATIAAIAGALVVIATRHDPVLSPDSITYLSGAAHLHRFDGLVDFTLKPLTVFGPVYPLLLAIGGRSLVWAKVVGVAAIAAATVLAWVLLRDRVCPVIALGAAAALGVSQGLVRMASVVWSETTYAAIALATLIVLTRPRLTTRLIVVGGLLAGAGFLTRYAGVGLIVAGATIVLVASWSADRTLILRRLATYGAAAFAPIVVWVVRNAAETGQPLGSRFEGGVHESITETVRLALVGTGHIVIGDGWSETGRARLGAAIVIGLTILAAIALRSRRALAADAGMAMLAATSFVVPIVARHITANDIELRVMSPMLIPIVYFVAVTFDRIDARRVAIVCGAAVLGWWCYHGIAFAARFPDYIEGSSGYKPQYAPQLYDVVDALPPDAVVMTNNPQRVWWFTGREPTLFGFTRPRPGNSHYPLDAAHTLAEACTGRAYLAWFDGLQNAGGGPGERRPDLTAIVDLQRVQSVPGGELYFLVPRDASSC